MIELFCVQNNEFYFILVFGGLVVVIGKKEAIITRLNIYIFIFIFKY